MSDQQINLAKLRQAMSHNAGLVLDHDESLALVEAVEAARRLTELPFGALVARDFYALRETLARFDFGGRP